MDSAYMGKLLLSMLFFAPGVIILVGALFVGLLMMLEKFGVLSRGSKATDVQDASAVNPPKGQIVAELESSLEEATEKEKDRNVGS